MRGKKLVAIGAAAMLALTACGAGDNGNGLALAKPFADVIQLVAAAKDGAAKSKSSKIDFVAGTGAEGMTATGAGVFDGANSKFALVTDSAGEKSEMRYVDRVIYVKLSEAQLKQMGATTPWIKISPDATDPFSKVFSQIMTKAVEQSDPTRTLEQVEKAGKIVSSDQTQLNGEPVNHYVVDLDVQKSIEQFTGDLPAEVRSKITDMLKGKDIHLPGELWLNKDQLPVQVKMDSSALAAVTSKKAVAPGAGIVTTKYTDWGSPVDVAAPAADQVSDLGELIKKAGH
ncbi:hypothetical protein [Amycolatopsis sp. H20-H5]|uniref:hypothetical protein n=1 Tax=Amycolatopsis sp. H20-H5 TaxID=3046309 RepID=UPI002DBD161D|nr:hypothetical protein [Amycolatopsis sp. H20-H5]MEC3980686.1 hypothetical protein [Amycolatopsis sp. H20-H5]